MFIRTEMRKIKYNISEYAVINRSKTLLSALSVILLSFILILTGVLLIVHNRKELKENLTSLNNTKDESEYILKKGEEWEKEISKKRKIWKKEIDFINGLIAGSTRPIVVNLSLVESILPDRVFVKELSLDQSGNSGSMLIRVSAGEFSDLLSFYDKLKMLKNRLTFKTSNEEFSDLESSSTIRIVFKNNEL
jgi:hypothetical protein